MGDYAEVAYVLHSDSAKNKTATNQSDALS